MEISDSMLSLMACFVDNSTAESRSARIAQKAVENCDKKPLVSSDVVDADNFTFEVFKQPVRNNGDAHGQSGELLLATHKQDTSKKYVIKHESPECAANEFVYTKMAQAIGLKMPHVKLFRLSDPLDDTLFKTEYVIGFEYLNARHLNLDEINSVKNPDDFYKFQILYRLFKEYDKLEILLADDGYIYRIDTSDSFGVCHYHVQDNDAIGRKILNPILHGMKTSFLQDIDSCIERNIAEFGENKARIFYEPLYAILKIHKTYINKFLDTLCYFYPDYFKDFYNDFFIEVKKTAKKLIKYSGFQE